MVVIGIVGVLSAIAVPTYKAYTQKAKMTEVNALFSQNMKTWARQNDTGDWNAWNLDSTLIYPTIPAGIDYIDVQYINWNSVAITLLPGYFNRLAPTTVNYTPIVNGVSTTTMSVPEELAVPNAIITWSCDVSGPAGAYAGGYTTLEFQQMYFPNCTCLTC